MISLVKSDLLSPDNFKITEFNLEEVNEAVEFAAANSGAFKLTVIKP